MVSTSSAITIKILIDLSYLILLLLTYFWPIFTYDDDFEIGLLNVKYKFHSDGLSAYVKANYNEFDDHLCKSSIDDTKKVCEKIDKFKLAGLIYLIFTAFGGVIVSYGILNLIGKAFRFTARGCLHLDFSHYLNPFLTLLSLGIYCLVVKLYEIDYEVHIGIFSMFFIFFVALFSFLFFCLYKKRINYDTGEYAKSVVSHEPLNKKKQSSNSELEISNPSIIK
jgi:hypothetical protein